jgi:DNA polymerase-3 subunit delta'
MFGDSLVGQPLVRKLLNRLIHEKRIPHAVLLHGPNGSGKVASALELARTLHCEREEAGPCESCRSCTKTRGLNHPDFSVLMPFQARTKQEAARQIQMEVLRDPYGYTRPEENLTIPIDHVRDLQKRFAYSSFEGSWRTTVILHADLMRAESANAILKTLEEPPDLSVLILTAPSPGSLLPTIVSRCQGIKLVSLSVDDVREALVSHTALDSEKAGFIARTCGGNLRLALEMANSDPGEAQDRAFRFLEALTWGEESRTYAALEQLSSDRSGSLLLIRGAEIWLRDILVYSHGAGDLVSQQTRMSDVERLSSALNLNGIARTLRKIEDIREMNHRNVNMHMALVSLWREMKKPAN